MAKAKPTETRPKNLSVRRTPELDDALAVLARTGLTESDAVRLACSFLAHGYRDLWDKGILPEGVAPRAFRMQTALQDVPGALTCGYGARPTQPPAPRDRSQPAPHARPTMPIAS